MERYSRHLIDERCVEILLRVNKTRDDYYEFIEARENYVVRSLNKFGFAKAERPSIDDPDEIVDD